MQGPQGTMEELPYALASLPLSSLGLLKVHALCCMGDVLLRLREYAVTVVSPF